MRTSWLRTVGKRLLMALAMFGPCAALAQADNLYIGDASDDSVRRFDATTGAFVDTFVSPGSGGLFGVRGMIFDSDHNLLVVDQNVDQPTNGEVLRYSGADGSFMNAKVPEPIAPYAPRGIVSGHDGLLYVADMGGVDSPPLGGIARYNAATGAFVDRLTAPGLSVPFNPRGVVFGPDGLLYASNFEPAGPGASASILRFDPATGDYLGEFVERNSSPLLRAEGIVFGPDNDLYAVSFRLDANDTDKILHFDGQTGDLVDAIDLYQVGEPRQIPSQALLFGPGGALYVPIQSSGEVRRYDVSTGAYDVAIPAGGILENPLYLTFDNTDPATLAYVPEPASCVLLALGAIVLGARVVRPKRQR